MPLVILKDGKKQGMNYTQAAKIQAYRDGDISLEAIEAPTSQQIKEFKWLAEYCPNVASVDFSDVKSKAPISAGVLLNAWQQEDYQKILNDPDVPGAEKFKRLHDALKGRKSM